MEGVRQVPGTSRMQNGSRAIAIIAPLLLAGCNGRSPASALPTMPLSPAGWVVVASGNGDLRLTLPPWLVPFETTGVIFANEPPPSPGSVDWLQLLAEGPATAVPQPAAGQSLPQWLEARLESPNRGPVSVRTVALPAGTAVELSVVMGEGTSLERRFLAFAIRAPAGVAYLLVDGPPAAWTGREADVALIPMLAEVGPAPR